MQGVLRGRGVLSAGRTWGASFSSGSGGSCWFGCRVLVLPRVSVYSARKTGFGLKLLFAEAGLAFRQSLTLFFQIPLSKKKKKRPSPFWDHVQKLMSAEATPKMPTFARTYGSFRWPCGVAQDQTLQGALDVGISRLS